jgi:hypothetical protein
METTTARTVKEAHGAYCATCNQVFNISTEPYWHWTKSVWMHRSGTGHKVEMYKLVVK